MLQGRGRPAPRRAQRRPHRLRRRQPTREALRRRRHPLLAALGDVDQRLLLTMRTRGHGPAAEAIMKALGAAGEWAVVWVGVGLGAAALDSSRRWRWLAAAAVGPAGIGFNYVVKVAVGRERPLIEEHPPLARAPSKLSFPSAHATSSAAAATAMCRIAPTARIPLYGLAGGICASRPYLGMHYPSDVLAGIALGITIGRLLPGLGVEEAPGAQ